MTMPNQARSNDMQEWDKQYFYRLAEVVCIALPVASLLGVVVGFFMNLDIESYEYRYCQKHWHDSFYSKIHCGVREEFSPIKKLEWFVLRQYYAVTMPDQDGEERESL